MSIPYNPNNKGGVKIPSPHDPDSVALYTMEWGACEWLANTFYTIGDEIKPTVSNGMAYVCIKSGISGLTEPTFTDAVGDIIDDGTATWRCKENTRVLTLDEDIIVSTWSGPVGFEYQNADFSSGKTWLFISAVPANATSMIVTNTIETSKGQTLQASMILKIADR